MYTHSKLGVHAVLVSTPTSDSSQQSLTPNLGESHNSRFHKHLWSHTQRHIFGATLTPYHCAIVPVHVHIIKNKINLSNNSGPIWRDGSSKGIINGVGCHTGCYLWILGWDWRICFEGNTFPGLPSWHQMLVGVLATGLLEHPYMADALFISKHPKDQV